MDTKMFVTVESGKEEINFDGIDSVSVDENHVTLYKFNGDNSKMYQLNGKIIRCFVSYAPFTDNPKIEKYELS